MQPRGFGQEQVIARRPSAADVLSTNKVLRSTYMLLAATLLFSALMAMVAMAVQMPYLGPFVTLGGYFGLLFLTHMTRNSAMGLVSVFALTGFMGLTLGPLLSAYLTMVPNGGQVIASALATTGLAFVGLSAYALMSGKDFSFLRGFVIVGVFALLGVILASLFFDLSAYASVISGAIILLMGALILFQTGQIVHGGETNYIMATVTLYVSIYNIFVSLLQLFGMAGDD
ncbi:MAG: Bax inhibitor-1/YccA family protein [Gammaproteobacteria bacterium]|nr:Bax inhibitor-1/YccA family protein [Gammaproteobacteria bacterium]TVQ49841.1 MAG: Bax inhibitor-1/YccA family protein [Gammaproteobacteria bacterium]